MLFEQQGSRCTDFRRGHRLGSRDHVVTWRKPRQRPRWMAAEQYEAFPSELTVREVKVDKRVLVTTLLDAKKTGKKDLSELYVQRWQFGVPGEGHMTSSSWAELPCKKDRYVPFK